jgi:1,4-dihydroxy-2-naphthoyl-CoA synthase
MGNKMIKIIDELEYIKELLANDAPTTEIVEVIDALASQTQNYDAAIFLELTNEGEISINVGGDNKTRAFGFAITYLVDAITDKINLMNSEAEQSIEKQLALDTDVESVSTAQE